MLRSLGRCCLGKVDLLVAVGDAVEVLPVSLSCPLPLLRTRPPSLLVCCFLVFAEMVGATSTAFGRRQVNLFSSEKRGEKSHFGIILVSSPLSHAPHESVFNVSTREGSDGSSNTPS